MRAFFKIRAFSPGFGASAVRAAGGVLLAAAWLFAGALFSCSNLGGGVSEQEQASVSDSAGVQASLSAGKGLVQGSIQAGADSRTIIPQIDRVILDIAQFRVYAYGRTAGGTDYPKNNPVWGTVTGSLAGGNLAFSISPEYGNWTVQADALDSSGNVLMAKTAPGITLNAENPVLNLNLPLSYTRDDSATGKIDISVAVADSITKVVYSFSPLSGGGDAITGEATPNSSKQVVFNSSLDSAFGSMAAGTYRMDLLFYEGDEKVFSLDQMVQVYSNVTTQKIDGTGLYINGGVIDINEGAIQRYRNSEIFVSANGNDGNTGTRYDPVKTLSRAVALTNAVDNGKIFVLNNVDMGDNIDITRNVTIQSEGSAAFTVTGQNKKIAVNAANVKIENLNFYAPGTISISAGKKLTVNKSEIYKFNKVRGDGYAGVFDVYGSLESSEDLVIRDCTTENSFGAGICMNGGSSVTLAGAKIQNCTAGGDSPGGAIYMRGSALNLTDVTISGCSAGGSGGGAIYVQKTTTTCIVTISGQSQISGNTVTISDGSSGGGGAIYLRDGTLNINGGKISGNNATIAEGAEAVNTSSFGGGIYKEADATLNINGTEISGNTGTERGGAVYLSGGNVTIQNADIKENKVTAAGSSGASGGGIYILSGQLLLKDSFVSRNIADQNGPSGKGGGIYISDNAEVLLSGSTIVGEQAQSTAGDSGLRSNYACSGGGIYNKGGSLYIGYTPPGVTDSSFTGGVVYNFARQNGGGVYSEGGTIYLAKGGVDYNCAYNGSGGGFYLSNRAGLTVSGGTVESNIAGGKNATLGGGAVMILDGCTADIKGGTISGNKASSSNGAGGAVYQSGTLNMEGAALFTGTASPKNNDIYLAENKTVNISGALTGTGTQKITLTPAAYQEGKHVISGSSALIENNITKFAVSDDSWTLKKITEDGTVYGALYSSTIYVGGSGANDVTGTGTQEAPYATIAKALTVAVEGSSIVLLGDTTESASLNIEAGKAGLTIKSSANTTKCTVTAAASSYIIKSEVNVTFENLIFNGWGGLNIYSGATELNYVTVKNGSGNISGGGLYINGASVKALNLNIENCTISESGSGGGITVEDAATLNADGITIKGCSVTGANGQGGGIYNSGTCILKDAVISGCSAQTGNAVYNQTSGTLQLEGSCDIQNDIHIESKNDPVKVEPYFELKSDAAPIVLDLNMTTGSYKYDEGSVVARGYSVGTDVTAAQAAAFTLPASLTEAGWYIGHETASGSDATAVLKRQPSVSGGITINFEGDISFDIQKPSEPGSNQTASFKVFDGGTEINPESARIEIRLYGTVMYGADAQSVTAAYLMAGSYEVYCHATIDGLAYDTTQTFTVGY